MGWCGVSCNNDDDSSMPVIENTALSNVEVSYFGLGSAPRIDEHVDTLFFSVDLANGVIFNADSLPIGTRRANATVKVTVASASSLELLFTDAEGEAVIVNYLQNPSDSVYFGNNDVKLRIVSADGKVQRDYQVKLNVHEKKPDSLYWDTTPFAPLPTSLVAPSAQKTVEMGGRYYTLASDGVSATWAVTTNLPRSSGTYLHRRSLLRPRCRHWQQSTGKCIYVPTEISMKAPMPDFHGAIPESKWIISMADTARQCLATGAMLTLLTLM